MCCRRQLTILISIWIKCECWMITKYKSTLHKGRGCQRQIFFSDLHRVGQLYNGNISGTKYERMHSWIYYTQVMWPLTMVWVVYCISYDNCQFNPLHAKFFRRNIYIYLYFMSILHIDMAQVLKILPRVRPVPTYSTQSISLLLLSWRRKEPGHQQEWYWPSQTKITWSPDVKV